MKFTLSDAYPIEWEGIKAKSYSSADDFANASAIVFNVDGSHGKIKSTVNDRVYYVISGSGKFDINGRKIQVKTTDVVIVPKNTPYDYNGKMKLFLVHTPAFDPKGDILLEKKKGRKDE